MIKMHNICNSLPAYTSKIFKLAQRSLQHTKITEFRLAEVPL